ncbi:DNA-binding NarL/FixJ family response regulator [Nocardiopsis mwathae]|uniref:DNA-binding NarL/FixJ family response regulator n=1 Tax=Nocardiopsis mwathae TaxID=1472723 RepID=A0A7W9YF82_9ACTN|nr:DNA-binding NarL/FixJ family response regulator [Nocardiopsis mwathae]
MLDVSPITCPARLYGRDRERSTVRRLLADARTGTSGALLVLGEPGIGKTSLLDDARTAAPEFTALEARGVPAETDLAFAGLHRLLRPVTGRSAALPDAQRDALDAALGQSAAGAPEPFLLSVAVLSLLTEVAQNRPLLVRVDDAHWLDTPSLDALSFTARRAGTEGMCLLVAARGEVRAAEEDHTRLAAGVPVLRLDRLDADAIHAILGDAAPHPPADAVRTELAALAQGNPLAAVELVASLTSDQLAGTEPLPCVPDPGGRLGRTYARRIGRLPEATRTLLLLMAAAEGLAPPTLVRAAEHVGADLGALEPAEADDLIRVGEDAIGFRHPLVRSAAYHTAGLARRRAAHLVLARVFDEIGDPLRGAWHRAATAPHHDEECGRELEQVAVAERGHSGYATSSRLFERAAELTRDGAAKADRLTEAARDAWLTGRPGRARSLLDRVRALGDGPGLDRARGRTELLRGHIELRTGIAIDAHTALGSAAERLLPDHRDLALHTLLHSAEAGALSGDHHRFCATADRMMALRRPDEAPHARIMFDYVAGKAAMYRGRYTEGIEPLRRAVHASEGVDDPEVLTWGGISALLLGAPLRAHNLLSRAVAVARRTGAVSAVPHALEFLTYAELWTGRLPLVSANATEGLRLADETGQRNCASHHRASLAMVAAIQGEQDVCRSQAAASLGHAEAHDLGVTGALATWALAHLDMGMGRMNDAVVRLRAMAKAGPGRGHTALRLLSAPHYLEAAIRTDDVGRAERALRSFDRWAQATGSDGARALAARCRALRAQGKAAEGHFEEAIALHQRGYCDFERARTELLFGDMLRRTRRVRRAREYLHGALETLERLNAVPWADQARAQLRASGESVRTRERPALESLSPQQLQIARFVAEGATNREVAAQLFLSPRTVDHHLRNVFTKLGIRSRVELARMFT